MPDRLVGLIETKPGIHLEGGKLNIYSMYDHRCNYFPLPQAETFYLQGLLVQTLLEKHP